ncbi:MAG TPA: LacI family DNA-binding transcriptional regulator [Dermatophilaceae bacterium]|nr:LacI family DNA-binding transcriptional regulator [Dermatophilaceae bacterium]
MPEPEVVPRRSSAKTATSAAPGRSHGNSPPRMEDVANIAGVSHQTVSRVLNDFPKIRPATRARVLAAIEELGYRRNTAARTLVTRRSGSIGVITADMNHFGPASIMLGLESASRAAGYSLSLEGLPEISATALRHAVDRVLDQAVEAVVIIVAHQAALALAQSLDIEVPLLLVEGDLSATPLTAGVDQIAGARLATNHLLDLGHQSVVHLPGPADWLEVAARRDGWRMALEERRAPVPALMVEGDWTSRSGYQATRAMLAEAFTATAIFAANDQMALGLLRALHEAGLRVPGDVSVVGFDDVPESGYFTPPLTTVRQDFAELGQRIMGLVLRRLAGELDASEPLVEPLLIIRSSTAAPAS